MFSKACEYAIRAVMFVAQKSRDGAKVGIREIAKGIDSPEHFIAKILQDLSRKGLISSQKGPSGGFFLDERSLKAPLADIVRSIDGDGLFTGCALGLRQCSEVKPCPLHDEFKKIRDDLSALLQNTTVGEFSTQLDRNRLFLKR
jgi:Rrf2 family protein